MLRSWPLALALSFVAGCGGSEAELACPAGFVRNDLSQCQSATCEAGPVTVETKTLSGEAATRFAVGDIVLVSGGPFDLSATTVVTFDGVPATVSGDPADPSRRLFATIPKGILDAPTQGAAAKKGVCVQVETKAGTRGATSITLDAARPSAPVITSVTPPTPSEGEELTISGEGFGPDAVVLLHEVRAIVVRTSSTELVVRVPDFNDILAGSPVPATLKVLLPDGSHALSGIRVRGN